MTFSIYGLRRRGDPEVRYIGQTNGPIAVRLHLHYRAATLRRHNTALCDWLLENSGTIEVFRIAGVETRAAALERERRTIALFAKRGNRLFNMRGLPNSPMALADKLGVSMAYASQLLSGARRPSLKTALHFFGRASIRLGPLVDATDKEIATLLKLTKPAPTRSALVAGEPHVAPGLVGRSQPLARAQ